MEIKDKREKTKLTVCVSGRIDTTTSPQLSEYFKDALTGVEELVLDIKDVDYISSAGLRVILFALKTMNSQGTMVVTNPNEDIMETFELTGFTDILTIA